jgi:hypothetical protein
VGNDGETLVADSSTSTGLRYQGNVAGGKNVIINGGFDIWQRGTSFTSTGANIPTADRFQMQAPTNGTVSQDTTSLPNGFRYGWKFTSGGSNAYMQSGTQIEFQNMENLQNNTVVISFWAKANNSNAGSTALTVRTRTNATIDAVAIFAGSNTDTSVTLTTSYVRYFVTRTFTTFGAVSLEFVLGANVSGDGFTIAGVQMELGSVATAFSKAGGTLQGELAACQRYYFRKSAGTGYPASAFGIAPGVISTLAAPYIEFPVQMRVNPTSIDYAGVELSDQANAGIAITSVVLAVNQGGLTAAVLDANTASGVTAYRPYVIRTTSTSGYLGFSAEL